MQDNQPQTDQEIKPEWINADNPPTPENPNISSVPQVHEVPVKKNNIFLKILASTALIALGVFGVLAYQKYFVNKPTTDISSPTPVALATPDSTADWKTYTSKQEKISFKYPSTWKVVTPAVGSTNPDGDALTIQSPSGKIKINWVSFVDGLGGACDTEIALGQTPTEGLGPCPLFTFMGKTPINGAPGLYVVSGTMTSDGKSYEPFMAVQDTNMGSLLSTQRTMGYDLYEGKNNGGASVLFATSGIYGDGQSLTESEAEAWFNTQEAQEAKQILLSLTY